MLVSYRSTRLRPRNPVFTCSATRVQVRVPGTDSSLVGYGFGYYYLFLLKKYYVPGSFPSFLLVGRVPGTGPNSGTIRVRIRPQHQEGRIC